MTASKSPAGQPAAGGRSSKSKTLSSLPDQPSAGDEVDFDRLAPGTSGSEPPPQPIAAVDRTLRLIEVLAEHGEVTLSEVRALLDVGASTAHRLTAMLVYRGFAERDAGSPTFRAGPKMFQLAHTVTGEHALVRHARASLEWLAEQSGETAHLGMLVGTDIRYLDVVQSTAALQVTGRVGQLGPAHATSMGKAMLATLTNDAVRRRYAGVPLAPVTPRTITALPALVAELARTRSRGWARNREENETGVYSVGVAVVHPTRGLMAGLSVAAPKTRTGAGTEREHAAMLRIAAARFVGQLPD